MEITSDFFEKVDEEENFYDSMVAKAIESEMTGKDLLIEEELMLSPSGLKRV